MRLPVFSHLCRWEDGWLPRPARRLAPFLLRPSPSPPSSGGGRWEQGARRSGRNRCSGCLWVAAGSCTAPSRRHLIWVLG